MTLQRIQALRDLDYDQLVNLAVQRSLLDWMGTRTHLREWGPDRLRLLLIDSICDEELAAQRETPSERRETLRHEGAFRDEAS